MLLEKLKKAQNLNLGKAAIDFMMDHEEELLAINRKKQLFDNSEDANGKSLFSKRYKRGVYSEATERISEGRKIAGEPYNLNNTGAFYRGFHITRIGDALLFGSTAEVAGLLETDFGDIFGLTPKNLQEFIDNKLKPHLIQYLRNAL